MMKGSEHQGELDFFSQKPTSASGNPFESTQLEFQDFGNFREAAERQEFDDPNVTGDIGDLNEDRENLLPASAQPTNLSFWSIEYYKRFFNVDTNQVLNRSWRSFYPLKGDFLESLCANPDLYGPFWIVTTLIFAIAITSNLSTAIYSTAEIWYYDFKRVVAGTALYAYAVLLPISVWGLLKWLASVNVSILELVCLYGYSLFFYIPVSILSVLQLEWLRWLLMTVALCLTGGTLLVNLYPLVKTQPLNVKAIILGVIIVCHAGLSIALKMYYFEYAESIDSGVVLPDVTPSPSPSPSIVPSTSASV
eukprot:Colp12_sorted_trinity150504_noHs@8018